MSSASMGQRLPGLRAFHARIQAAFHAQMSLPLRNIRRTPWQLTQCLSSGGGKLVLVTIVKEPNPSSWKPVISYRFPLGDVLTAR